MSSFPSTGQKRPVSTISKANDLKVTKVGAKENVGGKVCRAAPLGGDDDGGNVDLSDDEGGAEAEVLSSTSYRRDGSVHVPAPKIFDEKKLHELRQSQSRPITSTTSDVRGHQTTVLSQQQAPFTGSHLSSGYRPISGVGSFQQTTSRSSTISSLRNSILSAGVNASSAHKPALTAHQVLNSREHKDMKLVGGSLISVSTLLANSDAVAASSMAPSSSTSSGPKTATTTTGAGGKNNKETGKKASVPITGLDLLMSKDARRKHGVSVLHRAAGGHTESSMKQTKQPQQQQSSGSSSLQQVAAAKAKEILELEINQLLGRKSTHSEECDKEWFDGFDKRTEKLAEREAKQAKAASIVSLVVRAYHCKDCQLTHESQVAQQLCTGKGHSVISVSARKWFFECRVCRRRDFTLSIINNSTNSSNNNNRSKSGGGGGGSDTQSAPQFGNNSQPTTGSGCQGGENSLANRQQPTRRCECGNFDWVACGKYGSMGGNSSSGSVDPEHKLVLSATDWTSRKELATIATFADGL